MYRKIGKIQRFRYVKMPEGKKEKQQIRCDHYSHDIINGYY